MTVELREVGRVLSAKNATTLRQAKDTIQSLLSLIDPPDEDESDGEEGVESGEQAVHEAFAFLSDMMGVDLLECKDGCKYCPGMDESDDEDDDEDEYAEAQNLGGLVDLEEGAIRADGTTTIKVISPGWGSSGYYSAEVLQRDGPKAWPKGTHMYWDHPTPTEESERPERSLKDLAAVTTSDPRWWVHPTEGPGLYAEARVRSSYREAVNELAPHIGTSIRASGKATEGMAEGKKGRIVEAIVAGKSIDFVTMPGRGGKVLELFEAARGSNKEDKDDVSTAELAEARRKLAESEAKNAALREAVLGSAAAAFAVEYLAESNIHEATRTRLLEGITIEDLPVDNDGDLDEEAFAKMLDEAVEAEKAYIAALSGKKPTGVTGFGPSRLTESGGGTGSLEDAQKELVEAFKTLGMSDKEAAIAASGRA